MCYQDQDLISGQNVPDMYWGYEVANLGYQQTYWELIKSKKLAVLITGVWVISVLV